MWEERNELFDNIVELVLDIPVGSDGERVDSLEDLASRVIVSIVFGVELA